LRIFNRKNKSSAQTPGDIKILDMLGLGGYSGDALSEATYFACLRTLSESVAKLPLRLLKNEKDGGVSSARELNLYGALRYRPNPYMSAGTFWGTVENNRNHHGNAYCLITGFPPNIQLWILESEHVEVWFDDKKILSEEPALWYIYRPPRTGKTYKFRNEEILHFKTWASFDGIMGKPVREILRSTVSGGSTSQKLLNKLYDNGFTAKMVVQYTGNLNDGSEKAFAKVIEDYATGKITEVKSVIPIPIGTSITPLNIKLTDAQFIELRKYTALQIAAAFGIKPDQINDYDKSSYSSSEAQRLGFYVDTILPIIKQYEEEIAYKLLEEEKLKQGYHVKFNVASLLRASLKEQMDALARATTTGIYTPNEARAYLDLPAKPGGDKLFFNGSNIPVEMAGEQYKKKED